MNYWAYVLSAVAIFDIWLIQSGRESLSSQYQHASREHPVAVTAATAYLLAHLYGALPPKTDLLRGFGLLQRSHAWTKRQRMTR